MIQRLYHISLLVLFSVVSLMSLPCDAVAGEGVKPVPRKKRVVVAYVTSWSRVMPDASKMTHINYAFAHVRESFDGVRIDNEKRLREIVELKREYPHLKVMLSVGGWGSGRFSEMAADAALRTAFAEDCRRVVKEYNLDGIDIDWEYPTSSAAGISSAKDDTANFTLLMRDLRKALGKRYQLTLASVGSAKYVDFRAILKYIDFVNVMAYDMGRAPKHHTALFRSENTNMSSDDTVKAHLKAGVPYDMIVLGMAFYGRGGGEFPVSMDYKDIPAASEKYVEKWDDKAQAPYIADLNGKFVFGFDSPRSLAAKCRYIMERGLKGAMYWEYGGDNAEGVLSTTVYEGVLGTPISDEELQQPSTRLSGVS